MAKRLIDVSKLAKPPYAEDDNITGMGMSYDEQCGYNDGIDTVWSMLQHYTPTVDAVEVSVLEKWLYEIAMNNTGNPLSESCEEIIRRLPGLRKFAEEYGERKEG